MAPFVYQHGSLIWELLGYLWYVLDGTGGRPFLQEILSFRALPTVETIQTWGCVCKWVLVKKTKGRIIIALLLQNAQMQNHDPEDELGHFLHSVAKRFGSLLSVDHPPCHLMLWTARNPFAAGTPEAPKKPFCNLALLSSPRVFVESRL